ncbi:AmmeMemoRadiSam system protein B [Myxococcus sp. CA040A]|uniref:AmmeMemoRadiSam system protein B n=1 Tax=Myxococcus sp. CA040A TaxID=2741738 RepID=UPI00157B8BC5|nr:AmmeMemoRadiSam system protein B [Myxococcus sp. CA040A]NTX08827.1 AmmeMemoRadiSam system protein B [Myxococcus sp. CA040A]
MPRVRAPAVAGTFYSSNPTTLMTQVDAWLEQARGPEEGLPAALIVPHAGYVYSGAVAAAAYATLWARRAERTRVLLLGPCHFHRLRGLAYPEVDLLCTPLGDVRLDADLLRRATALGQVSASTEAHESEHALEVQLPFLQRVLERFTVLPLVVGRTDEEEVAQVLEALWDEDVLLVVTSDLSHYRPYEEARRADHATAARVLALEGPLDAGSACGAEAISGLLRVAKRRGLRPRLMALRSSGDAAGARDEVIGYGAFVFDADAPARGASR